MKVQRGPKATGRPPFTVFLDRDGVFNVNPKVGLRRPAALRWLPGAREGFARLNKPGIRTCLVTNQPWVGLLTATPGMVRRVNAHLKAELEQAGGRLDRIEAAYAPPFTAWLGRWLHGPRRRKPLPGMLEDAAAAFEAAGAPVDKRRAIMVGDKVKDLQAASRFGIPCILLSTTDSEAALRVKAKAAGVEPVAIVVGLREAVSHILQDIE